MKPFDPHLGPKVSVVIPAYNAGRLIVEAVESALNQTLDAKEIIVVDDGSTDETPDLLADYADRVTYIRFQQNRGPGAARNAGIEASSGQYIALLDADDLFMPERLEKLADFLDHNSQYGFATSDAYYMFEDVPSTRSYFSVPDLHFALEDQDVWILRSNFVGNKLMFRRSLFERFGLYDETLWFEDWDRNVTFIMGGERCGFLPEALAYHRIRPNSLTSRSTTVLRDRRRVLERWLSQELRAEARAAAEEALAEVKWALIWVDDPTARRSEVKDLIRDLRRAGPTRFRLRAAILTLLSVRGFAILRNRRFQVISGGGAHWALQEAAARLEKGDFRGARKNLWACILFGYPVRTRLNAFSTLLPMFRKAAVKRLLDDPILKDGPVVQ